MWRNSPPAPEAYSLRKRLFVRLFAVLAVLAVALFLFVDSYARRAADSALDQVLLASALAIADAVRVEDGRITVDMPHAAFAILAQARRDRLFYRVGGPDGATLTGYADLSAPAPRGRPNGVPEPPQFADGDYRGVAVRLVSLRQLVVQAGTAGTVTVTVAQTRESRQDLAADILANAFAPILLVVLAGAGLLGLGIRQALAPLAELERRITARPDHDFSPIAAPAPREVAPLVAAINHAMGRLKGSLDMMQLFLADATHQIRTPLASLRAQAEVAVEEDDPAALRRMVARIHRNAVEASQLATQLLNLAMVIHRGEARRPEAVDLCALATQAVQRVRTVEEEVPILLTLDPPNLDGALSGDAVSLREALANLIDNAVRYGAGGPVEVALRRRPEDNALSLTVADHGPGIPEAERDAVLRRFSRGSTAAGTSGSGLGLAIVQSVARAHGATLSLNTRPGGGLLVRLDFPPAPAPPAPPEERGSLLALGLGLLVVMAMTATTVRADDGGRSRLYPAPGEERQRLTVITTTDPQAMEPLIADFQRLNPETAIAYTNLETTELFAGATRPDPMPADLLIGSAADLQVKLVNDGLTLPHVSAQTRALPEWANWRDEAFAFTYEPVVMVYNTRLLPEAEVPRSREALLRLLRTHGGRLYGRVATYDAVQSGIGYLLASLDAHLFSGYWPLMGAMGTTATRLYCCGNDLLDAVERGEAVIGYNVLGSYARARAEAGAPIGIVMPSDYTLVVARVAVIPRHAREPALAGRFIDYLLSPRGQAVVAGEAALYALSPLVGGPATASGVQAVAQGPLRPIGLSPALLVFLDEQKRARFLEQWLGMLQTP